MIRLPEIKTAELSTYGNFAKCHQAHFRVSRVGLGTRLAVKVASFPGSRTTFGCMKECVASDEKLGVILGMRL